MITFSNLSLCIERKMNSNGLQNISLGMLAKESLFKQKNPNQDCIEGFTRLINEAQTRSKSPSQIAQDFDKASKGYLTRDDIAQGLNDYGILVQPAVIDSMYDHIDLYNNKNVSVVMLTQCINNFDMMKYQNMQTINPFQQQQTPFDGLGVQTQGIPRNLTEQEVFQKDKLEMIQRYLQEKNFTIESLFQDKKSYMGQEAVSTSDFQPFIQAILMSQDDAQRFAGMYQIIGTDLIDFQKFSQDLNKDKLNEFKQEEEGRVVLEALFVEVRKHVITKGLDLWSKFKEFDLDNNNFITPNELYQILINIGFSTVTQNQLEQVYKIFDVNGDQKISYYEFCKQFAEFNNKKCITDRNNPTFNVFNQLRTVMKKNGKTIPQIFGITYDISSYGQPNYIQRQDFFRVCQVFGVPIDFNVQVQLLDMLDTGHNQQIDITHMIDLVGFVEPEAPAMNHTQDFGGTMHKTGGSFGASGGFNNTGQGFGATTGKRMDATRSFYKDFCKMLLQKSITNNQLLELFMKEDSLRRGVLNSNEFRRVLEMVDEQQKFSRQLLTKIAKDHDMNGNDGCFYKSFTTKVGQELEKVQAQEFLFHKFQETIQFNNCRALYDLFAAHDINQNRLFDLVTLDKVIKLYSIDLRQDQFSAIFGEYAWPDDKLFNLNEFETDYNEFITRGGVMYNIGGAALHANSPQKAGFNIPMILETMRNYSIKTGQHLRETFKKTNTHGDDYISAYDFGVILTTISDGAIPQSDIDRFARELQASNGKVQFSELMRKYNQHFSIMDDEYERGFQRASINKIFWTIAQKCLDRNMKLEQVFSKYDHLDSMHRQDFKQILIERFNILDISTEGHLNLASDSFTKQGDMIDHKRFLHEMEGFIDKQKQRSQILSRLAEHMTTKQQKLIEIFRHAKTPTQLNDELTKHQFYSSLQSIGFQIDMDSLEKVLNTFDMDSDGNVNFIEFCEAVDRLDGAANKTAKYHFNSFDDCITHLAKEIESRDKCELGSYLADADVDDSGTIARREFFQVMKAFKFGLGDGDIQAIMDKVDPSRRNNIPVAAFAAQVNPFIQNPNKKIHISKSDDYDDYTNALDDTEQSINRGETQTNKFHPRFRPYIKLCEDIIKACIARGQNTYDFFSLCVDQDTMISKDAFIRQVDQLELFSNQADVRSLYDQIDIKKFGRVKLYDIDSTFRTVVDKSIQQMKLDILEIVYDNIEKRQLNFYKYFHGLDASSSKVISEMEFKKFIYESIGLYNMNNNDFGFLSKQYDRNNDHYVAYEMLMKDLEDVAAKRGVNVTNQNPYASEGFGSAANLAPQPMNQPYGGIQPSGAPAASFNYDYTKAANPYGSGGLSGKYDPNAKTYYHQETPSYDNSYSMNSYNQPIQAQSHAQPNYQNQMNTPQYNQHQNNQGTWQNQHQQNYGQDNMFNQNQQQYTGNQSFQPPKREGAQNLVNTGGYMGGNELPDDLDLDEPIGGGFNGYQGNQQQPNNPNKGYQDNHGGTSSLYKPQVQFISNESAKNTKQGMLAYQQRAQPRQNSCPPDFLEAIMNFTYLKGQLVEDFFAQYGQRAGQTTNLQFPDFQRALGDLNFSIKQEQLRSIYEQLAGGQQRSITAVEIDAIVEAGAKKTVENFQLDTLHKIYNVFKANRIQYREAIEILDKNGQKRILLESFRKYIQSLDRQIPPQQIEILCKRYTHGKSTFVELVQFMDELDLINGGMDPRLSKLKDFALTLYKTSFIHGISIGEWVMKYHKSQDLDLTSLSNIMRVSKLDQKFSKEMIESYYNTLRDTNQGRLDVRMFQNKLMGLCPRSHDDQVKKILYEQVQYAKTHAQRNFDVAHIFAGLDQQGKGIIPKPDFITALMRNKDLRFQQIDVEFLAVFYAPRTHSDMVEYKNMSQEYERVKLEMDQSLSGSFTAGLDESRQSFGDTDTFSPRINKDDLIRKFGDACKFEQRILESDFAHLDKMCGDFMCTDLQLKQTIASMKISFSEKDIEALSKLYRNQANQKIDYKRLIRETRQAIENPGTKGQTSQAIQQTYKSL